MMNPVQISTVIVLFLGMIGSMAVAEDYCGVRSPYSIVIDGGSTGSRLHVFEFVSNHTGTECVRRGSARANVPLSDFRPDSSVSLNPAAVAEHLLPLFEYAATVVPEMYHATTGVKYQATAGMRLLEQDEQDAVYDALYVGLMQAESFVFRSMQRGDIATLGGDLEGFYGAVAANYLEGLIDTTLHTKASHEPIGALDMGGSSTQIVYLPTSGEKTCSADQTCPANGPSRLTGEDFFATSYLSYGVDQFRERLWNTWIEERKSQTLDDTCDSKIIDNPCTFKGYQIEWEGYILLGTGNTDECIREVQRLIPHPEERYSEPVFGQVGGVEHPPVKGKFYAMSLYFFTLDSLRELSHAHKSAHEALNLSWPNPSIEELHNALEGLCSRSWKGDLEDIQDTAHAYTRPEVLPHRCLESVYMVTLLKDGFGFHPSSRDITFTFLVDGSEVEWSLGMALALHAEEVANLQDTADRVETNMTLLDDCETSPHTPLLVSATSS